MGYDSKGNITAIGSSAYGYSSENLLTSAPGYTLTYDPLNRFYELVGTNPRRPVYDGDELIMEYHPNGAMSRRFVHGPGTDEPLVWYGGGGSVRRFLHITTIGASTYGYSSEGSDDQREARAGRSTSRFGGVAASDRKAVAHGRGRQMSMNRPADSMKPGFSAGSRFFLRREGAGRPPACCGGATFGGRDCESSFNSKLTFCVHLSHG